MELIGRYSNSYAHLVPLTRLMRLLAVEKRSTDRNACPVAMPHKLVQRFTPRELKEMVSAYKAGASPADIGRQYDISQTGATELLVRLGVTLRQRGLSEEEVAEATRLYESGLSLVSVGARIGKNHATVRNYLRRAGVKMRDTSGR